MVWVGLENYTVFQKFYTLNIEEHLAHLPMHKPYLSHNIGVINPIAIKFNKKTILLAKNVILMVPLSVQEVMKCGYFGIAVTISLESYLFYV